jgi:hypothetical protein
VAKRKAKRREPEVPSVDYTDAEGNVLTLRGTLSAGSIRKIRGTDARDSASTDDVWRRRTEMLFERLTVSWEIAGLPLTDQKMLLGRYRMADPEMQRWVRETLATHVDSHIPELSGL